MLGHYENFPVTIHGINRFSYKTSSRKVQQAVVSAFYRLNRERFRLEEIVCHFSPTGCEVNFEFGVGEGAAFSYLEKKELEKLRTEIKGNNITFLDFLCVLRYHVVDEFGGCAPLKFDYYLLRFAFGSDYVEFLISHERGPRHVHVEDLMEFLTKYVKMALVDNSPALKLEDMGTA